MKNQPVGKQVAAVESEVDRLLVLAPPGCGKTEILAMRAERLIRTGVVRPGHRLLAVTFTNRARDNLKSRLRQQLGETTLRNSVAVMNFHELAARVVEAHGPLIGLDRDYSPPNPAWLRRALAAQPGGKQVRREAEELLGTMKRQPLTDDELLDALRDSGNDIALAIEQQRLDEKHIDYGDLIRYAQLIVRNDRVAGLLQAHFDALLVDEFQDLSLQQFELTLATSRRNATFVGDPFQGIYGWAGAAPVAVHADLIATSQEVIELDVSFRSSPAVLAVVNSVATPLGSPALSAADPDSWDDQGWAYALEYPGDAAEADGIVSLTDYLATRYPDDTIGVICRAVYRRGALDRAYERADHPPQFWDFALDTPRVVRLLKAHAKQVDPELSHGDQVEDLRQRVCGAINAMDIDTLAEVNTACDQLLEYEHEDLPVRDLMARFRDNLVVAAIAPGVHVLNAHVGKGQQFDWVVVMGIEEGHVPSTYSDTPEKILEDQRILLVMVSRARKGLFLTRADKNTNQYGRQFTNKPSRWWAAMATAARPTTPGLSTIMKVG